MKINNYFYQFEIDKEWEKVDKLLSTLKNNITLIEHRVSKDYKNLWKKVSISAITKVKSWEYRINLVKFHYGFKSNFLDKSTDFSKFSTELDTYGRDSWKKKNESEEVHFYCCLKIWISNDWKFVKWILSVPRVKEWITTVEINNILRYLFKSIFKKQWYYRNIRPAYSEENINKVFSKATEIKFVRDENPWNYFSENIKKQIWTEYVSVHSSISDEKNISKIHQIFSNFLPKSTNTEVRKEISALRNFTIITPDGTFSLEWDDFKLKCVIEVNDYINTMKVSDRTYFTQENLRFINKSFLNFFKK